MKNNALTVKIARTPEMLEVVKKLGSRNKTEAMAAAEALAAVLPQPILQVINQAAIISSLYTTFNFENGQATKVDLDPFYDVRAGGMVNVWSAFNPGGTATNFVQGQSSMFVNTYPLDTAASANKKALRASNIDYLGAILTKAANEVLLKQEKSAAEMLMISLAGSRIDFNPSNNDASNLLFTRSATQGQFGPADFNAVMTKYDRVISSFVGGTPSVDKGGIDTMLGSPEFFGQIRAMAYNPVNTRAGSTGTTQSNTSLAAPDALREEIFRTPGIASFYGIELRKVWEFGIGKTYNTLLGNQLGSQVLTGYNDSGTAAFSPTTEQAVVGLNSSMFDLVRARAKDEVGSDLSMIPDDTFTIRSDKIGWYMGIEEGYVSVDGRAKFACIY